MPVNLTTGSTSGNGLACILIVLALITKEGALESLIKR